ncbi:MAG: tetratricopeptide repeat-containing protein, partial [Acidobacteria bacterium]|nr:tetratricopeptide repeat-containing protein [Acidobacteriota bacterium]
LLRRHAPQLIDTEASRIADALGDLPLALAQASAYLAEATDAEDYLSLFDERAAELLDHGVPNRYSGSLAASVQVALNRLAAQSPAAPQLLILSAYLASEPIPLTLFTAHPERLPNPLRTTAADPLAFTALIQLVRKNGLARVESAALHLHRLSAAILRDQPHQQQDLFALAVRLLRAAVPAENPWEHPLTWPVWRQLLPHILFVIDLHRPLTGVEEDVAWLLNHATMYLRITGEGISFIQPTKRALGLRRSRLGEDHPDTLESASNLALNLWALGQYEQGRQLAEDTFTRCRRALGDTHPHTVETAYGLVLILYALGWYEHGHQIAQETFAGCRRAWGDDHTLTLKSASSLALNLVALGHYEQSCQLAEDTITRIHKLESDFEPYSLTAAYSLVAALRELGQYEQAQQLGNGILTDCRQLLGDDHINTLIAAHALATCLQASKQYEQAYQLGEDTFTRCCRRLSDDHPYTLISASGLATTLRELGQYELARQLGEDTLPRMRQILGPNHPETLISASHLAITLHKIGHHEQTRQLAEDALTRMRQALGNNHPHTMRWIHIFANLLET